MTTLRRPGNAEGREKRRVPLCKRIYRSIIARLLAGAFAVIPLLKLRTASRLGALLGNLAFLLARSDRLRSVRDLRMAFKSRMRGFAAHETARRSFRNIGRNAMDLFSLSKLTEAELAEMVACCSLAPVAEALAQGYGVVVLSAHLDNWELLAAYLSMRLGGLHVVGKRIRCEEYNELIVGLRRRAGVVTLYRDSSPRPILRLLRQGKPLGLLADQDLRKLPGLFVPFFGRLAYTPTAPAELAFRTGARIVPVFTVRTGIVGHSIICGEPIVVKSSGDPQEAVYEATVRWSRAVEAMVRRYPDQWVWFQRRWRTRPPLQ